ncbi:porin [Chitinilyticum litopenaei]|uniref:porin n=1 Tax=Chitinilyticum litopenaei TaxID=1121276 RepID=UPI0004287285|nr:porin [Chitinilyticum litopenaei]
MFKRALVAAALAAAFSASAQAEVSITGSMEMNIMTGKNLAGTGTGQTVLDRGLQLDFNGADKLDMGGKLIWKVSQKLNTGNPAASGANVLNQNVWGGREAWVGFAGDWGSFKVGRQFLNSYLVLDWPYGQGGFWQLAENNWYSTAAGGKLTANYLSANSVNYQSPSFSGFSFGLQHSWDVNSATAVGKLGDSSITDLSAAFSTGGLTVNAGYLFGEEINTVGSNEEQWYVGATYATDFGLNLRALYEAYTHESASGTDYDGSEFIVGATYGWGKHFVKGAYQYAEGENAGGGDVDGNIWSIEYGYSLSKNTVGYVRYQDRSKDVYGDVNYFMVGVWTGF